MLFTPSPCHKLSHLLGPPPTSSVTYFMDGPWYCQGRTGFKIRSGQFPDDLPPYRPSLGKINKNSEITLFHVKMTVFTTTLPAHRALPKCKHGYSPPLDIVKCQVKFCLLLYFLHRFLINLASTAMEGRMKLVGGPRVGQHCYRPILYWRFTRLYYFKFAKLCSSFHWQLFQLQQRITEKIK